MSGETATSTERPQHQAETDGIQLLEGESVLENRRPSWTLWWWQIGLAVLVLLIGVGSDAPIGAIVAAGLIFGYVVLSRANSRYIITDERIKGKIGLLSSKTMEYRISDLRSLATSQGIFERLVGHGTLEFQAGANNKLIWHGVPDYEQVAHTARERQRAFE